VLAEPVGRRAARVLLVVRPVGLLARAASSNPTLRIRMPSQARIRARLSSSAVIWSPRPRPGAGVSSRRASIRRRRLWWFASRANGRGPPPRVAADRGRRHGARWSRAAPAPQGARRW